MIQDRRRNDDKKKEEWRMERWKREMEGIRNGRLVSMLAADHCGEKKRSHVTAPIPDEPELQYVWIGIPSFILLLICTESTT